jgi:hypothetical protein
MSPRIHTEVHKQMVLCMTVVVLPCSASMLTIAAPVLVWFLGHSLSARQVDTGQVVGQPYLLQMVGTWVGTQTALLVASPLAHKVRKVASPCLASWAVL